MKGFFHIPDSAIPSSSKGKKEKKIIRMMYNIGKALWRSNLKSYGRVVSLKKKKKNI